MDMFSWDRTGSHAFCIVFKPYPCYVCHHWKFILRRLANKDKAWSVAKAAARLPARTFPSSGGAWIKHVCGFDLGPSHYGLRCLEPWFQILPLRPAHTHLAEHSSHLLHRRALQIVIELVLELAIAIELE